MADFDICYPFVLGHEDSTPPKYEVVMDPVPVKATDSEEVANAKRTAKAISGINSFYWPQEFAIIVAIPQNQRGPAVKKFYQVKFWNSWFDRLDSNNVAAMILDSSVNQGPGTAVRFAQNAAGLAENEVDGRWGMITVAAINSTPEGNFVPRFIAERSSRYQALGGGVVPQWIARASRVPDLA